MLRTFVVHITLPDGSSGRHQGHYSSGCSAILFALRWFPQAKRITARRAHASPVN